MKKIVIIILLCLLFFLTIYKLYKNKETETYQIYLLQVGAYKNYDNVVNMTKYLDNYYIYKENDLYKVIIGVTLNNNIYDKLINLYKIDNVFKKSLKITNKDFYNNIKKYDILINESNDKEVLNNIIKKELIELENILN